MMMTAMMVTNLDVRKNMGHGEKKILNKRGRQRKFRTKLWTFQGKQPEFRRKGEFRKKLWPKLSSSK